MALQGLSEEGGWMALTKYSWNLASGSADDATIKGEKKLSAQY